MCGAPRGNVRQSTICAAKHKNTFFLSYFWNKKTSFGWVVNVMLACLSRNSIVASTGPINLKYTHWRAHIFLMYIITYKAVWIWRKQLVWPFDHSLQPKAGILAPWSQRCLPHVGNKNKEAGHLVEDSRVFFFPPPPTNSQLWLIVHKLIVPPGSGVMLFFALSQNIPLVSTAGHAGLNERGKVNFLEKLQDLARRSELRH